MTEKKLKVVAVIPCYNVGPLRSIVICIDSDDYSQVY